MEWKEPWYVECQSGGAVYLFDNDNVVRHCGDEANLDELRRIAACINACEGIKTEELEEGQFFMSQRPESRP